MKLASPSLIKPDLIYFIEHVNRFRILPSRVYVILLKNVPILEAQPMVTVQMDLERVVL